MERDLGPLGESTFKTWCAATGITANESHQDRTGWDFFLEWSMPRVPGNPIELHAPSIECKVQIKATDGSSGKIQVPLSSLRLMATSPLPSFYIFIEFNGKAYPTKAYVKHVDRSLIARILEKVHKAETGKRKKELNHSKMTISFDKCDALHFPSGEHLKNSLTQHIGDYGKYLEHKREHLRNVGFGEHQGEMKFTIVGIDNLRKFIDMSLGSGEAIEITNILTLQSRFGITSEVPIFKSNTAYLQLSNREPEMVGKVLFKEHPAAPGVSFKARLYRSIFPNTFPNSLNKARIDTDFFNIFISLSPKEVLIETKQQELRNFSLRELRNLYKLFTMLNDPSDVCVDLLFGEKCASFKFIRQTNFGNYEQHLKVVDAALCIINAFEIHEDVSITEEVFHEKCDYIHSFSEVIKGGIGGSVTFDSPEKNIEYGDEVIYVSLYGVEFCELLVVGIVTISGACQKLESGKYFIHSDTIELKKKLVISPPTSPVETITSEIKKIIKSLEGSEIVIDGSLEYLQSLHQ